MSINELARMKAKKQKDEESIAENKGSNSIIRSLMERIANAESEEEREKIQKRLDVARQMLDR